MFINPGAGENCFDGIDNNCDNLIDHEDPVCPQPCIDEDGDGYDNATCGGTDCDDNNSAVNPGVIEADNGIDDNCDGHIDEGFDLDNDGFTPFEGDCDDTDETIYPEAPEVDDGKDNNCDGQVDEALDRDGDGFTPIFDGDCDDSNATVYPDAPQVPCDGIIDQDCDDMEDLPCEIYFVNLGTELCQAIRLLPSEDFKRKAGYP